MKTNSFECCYKGEQIELLLVFRVVTDIVQSIAGRTDGPIAVVSPEKTSLAALARNQKSEPFETLSQFFLNVYSYFCVLWQQKYTCS